MSAGAEKQGRGGGGAYNRHLEIAKLVPKIFNRVQSNQSSDEESDQFNTSNTADAEPCHEQPEEPFGFKTLVLESMEFGPTQCRGNGATEEHRIEQNESANGCVRVLAEHHKRDEPNRWTPQVKLLGSPVGHRNANSTKKGVELAHKGIVDFFRIGFARLEFERPIVSSKVARETDK